MPRESKAVGRDAPRSSVRPCPKCNGTGFVGLGDLLEATLSRVPFEWTKTIAIRTKLKISSQLTFNRMTALFAFGFFRHDEIEWLKDRLKK